MNKLLCIFLVIILSSLSFGMELKISHTPKMPKAGESLQIYFEVSGDDLDQLEDIEFQAVGFEVLSKDSRTSSSRTTYINGKLTKHESQTISYDIFVPGETREITIKNPSLVTTKSKIRFSDRSIKIHAGTKSKDFFVRTVMEKNELYEGEGALVSYYLYSKTSMSNPEIKTFPALKGFLKRYIKAQLYTEKREYEGEIYNRTYLYSAYIFPLNDGPITVDSITVSARVAQQRRRAGDSFSVFGFSFSSSGRRVRKVVRSQSVKVNVKKLPRPIPLNFSGLVGVKNNFQFAINKNRFLANEPIEVKLTVKSDGQLEGFDSPEIFDETKFEMFDSDGKLSIDKFSSGRKEFTYTYLAKVSGVYPERDLSFSTFNPQTKKYEQHTVTIPSIKVAGGIVGGNEGKIIGASGSSNAQNSSVALTGETNINEGNDTNSELLSPTSSSGVYAPYFTYSKFISSWKRILFYISLLFAGVVSFLYYYKTKEVKFLSDIERQASLLKRKKINYANVYNFLDNLRTESDDSNMIDLILKSGISKSAQNYFVEILDSLSKKEFTDKNFKQKLKLKVSYIDEVVKKVMN